MLICFLLLAEANDRTTTERGVRCDKGIRTYLGRMRLIKQNGIWIRLLKNDWQETWIQTG